MFGKHTEKISIEQFHTLKSKVENLSNLVISFTYIEIMKNNNKKLN